MGSTTPASLNHVLAAKPHVAPDPAPGSQTPFQDSDGLISFVAAQTSLVTDQPEYKTGRDLCDSICNFFATLRTRAFSYLQANHKALIAGDSPPQTQWDPSVNHYIQYLLTEAGGFGAGEWVTETYSITQNIADFSTAFVKLIFDTAMVPSNVVTDMTKFLQGVGESMRAAWTKKENSYQIAVLSQCHEALGSGPAVQDWVYIPKIKYIFVSVDSSQSAFTSPCTNVDLLTFNFQYEFFSTALVDEVLDPTSAAHQQFAAFLQHAQQVEYTDATNSLDAVLTGTVSSGAPAPTGKP